MKIYETSTKILIPHAKFIEGRADEVEELVGPGLPPLPEGQTYQEHKDVILVELHPQLKRYAQELIEYLYNALTQSKHAETDHAQLPSWLSSSEPYTHYTEILTEILYNTLNYERRLGLLNLFWLAHSKEVSESMADFFSSGRRIKETLRYQIHPMLSGLYLRSLSLALQRFQVNFPEGMKYNLGANYSLKLVESIIRDQLALTEVSSDKISLKNILVSNNRRFKISFRAFSEIYKFSKEKLRNEILENSPYLMEIIRQNFPHFSKSNLLEEKFLLKLLFNPRVYQYIFMDYEGLGKQFLSSPFLIEEAQRLKGWHRMLEEYIDFLEALKKFEVIDFLRQKVINIPPNLDQAEINQLFFEGRLYRFREQTEIINNARKVTVLFADLRGFTRTSEGGISEEELTYELYKIFDPLSSLVQRFQGKIDKFTGDGAMVLFGVDKNTQEDELNALRTAIILQETQTKLRQEGKSNFQMGISIHTGRAFLAHFILDDYLKDTTVIGRNINLAGRLSSSGDQSKFTERKDEFENLLLSLAQTFSSPEDQERFSSFAHSFSKKIKTVAGVMVDEYGNLYNSGIAITRETIDELIKSSGLEVVEGQERTYFRYYDAKIQRKIVMEYVGDVKFKGVTHSLPIYGVAFYTKGEDKKSDYSEVEVHG